MDLCSKYKPIYISELEFEYPKIVEYLNSNRTFIVNGGKFCGKSTIVKLYLKLLNYDYLLIDDFNLSKENLIEKIKYRTNSVYSHFYNKKYIVVIDNFDLFDITVKDFIINNFHKFQYLIITNKFLNNKINYVRINPYSFDYILDLYCIIYYLEKGENCNYLPEINNISQMFSTLEFNLNSNNIDNINKNYDFKLFFDKFNFKFDNLVIEKNFQKKLYILDKLDSYNIFHNNLIYNYKSIEDLSDSYDNLSSSLIFSVNNHILSNNYNLEYYSILSIIGTSYKLDNFKIYKENFQIRKKKNLNYY